MSACRERKTVGASKWALYSVHNGQYGPKIYTVAGKTAGISHTVIGSSFLQLRRYQDALTVIALLACIAKSQKYKNKYRFFQNV